MKNRDFVFVVAGAALWGTISLFVNGLYAAGFTAMQIVALRALTATVLLWGMGLGQRRRIAWRDLPLFVGTGIISLVCFSWLYFTTIRLAGVSLAVILLYTAPAMVIVLSRIFFGERITKRKITALIMALIGLLFVLGLLESQGLALLPFAVLTGLGSALGYALYSVIGRLVLRKYDSITMIRYTFLVALVALLPVLGSIELSQMTSLPVLGRVIGLGLFPTALAYMFYTRGLSGMETGRASIVATVEPVVGTLIGVMVYGESLSAFQWGGIFLILISLMVVRE